MKRPGKARNWSFLILSGLFLVVTFYARGQEPFSTKFEPMDVFDIEMATDPQISPEGDRIAYVRSHMDIMTDRNISNIWLINYDGTQNRPLSTGDKSHYSPRWSPDGEKLAYISGREGSSQIYMSWLNENSEVRLSNLTGSPGNLTWSPDGKWLAFSMSVPAEGGKSFASMPKKPEGAKWSDPPKVIDKMQYRRDGGGYVRDAYSQIFVLSTDGGTALQVTNGDFNHGGTLSWSSDSKGVFFSANHHEDRDFQVRNSEIQYVDLETRKVTVLTDRNGPDFSPVISPDGEKIAYLGFDDDLQGYQITNLYVMNTDGSQSVCITCDFDRDVGDIQWAQDGDALFCQYDDEGNTKIARVSMSGEVMVLAEDVGGLTLGRPYSAGSFTVSQKGNFAFTHSTPDHPADLAVGTAIDNIKRLTHLNDDLFHFKQLGEVEEIWYESSHDQRKIQGWICKPPDFDSDKKYPLILEIHGGPFANYGDRFTAEIQLFAAAGYVVLYTNPRGSTSYGEEFGNLIHHNYPSEDYDDLISGVDAVIEKGYIDEDRLYVTGGSGGGVLTSWIVGKTNRFRAAVVAKPVINWYSHVLYADNPGFFARYWFPGYPWEYPEHYHDRSPISLVGNVTTPTMLLTGEDDFRTPMAETEQYYAALKLNKVETAMVRIQGAGHGIANRPSNLIAKVVYILGWFDKYK